MSRARLLFSDTLVLAFGTLGGRIIGILLLPLYTHALSRAEFGTVDLVSTGVDLVLPLIYLAISEAVLRFAMSRSEDMGTVVKSALAFVSSMSGLLTVALPVATIWLPWREVVTVGTLIGVQSLCLVLGAWARAAGHVKLFAASGLTQAIAAGSSNVLVLLVAKLGVLGFLLSLLIGQLAALAVLVSGLPLRETLRGVQVDRSVLRRMLLFSAPLVPNVVLWWITNLSGRFVLATVHGVEQVGLFAAASRFPAVLTMITTVFAQAWQLAANRTVETDDARARGRFFSRALRTYLNLLLLALSLLLVFLHPLVTVLVGPDFRPAWRLVPPLLIGATGAAVSAFLGAIYTAHHRSSLVFRTTVVAGVLAFVLNLVLVPPLGAMGAACSIALSFAALSAIRFLDVRRLTPIGVSGWQVASSLLLIGSQVGLLYSGLDGTLRSVLLAVIFVGVAVVNRHSLIDLLRVGRGSLTGNAATDRE